jgi:hypothetical protein
VRKTLGQHRNGTDNGDRPDRRASQSHDRTGACFRSMDRLGLAGLRHCRHGNPAPDGGSADLYATLCADYGGRDCRRGRPRRAGPDKPGQQPSGPERPNQNSNGPQDGGRRGGRGGGVPPGSMLEPEPRQNSAIAELNELAGADAAALCGHISRRCVSA